MKQKFLDMFEIFLALPPEIKYGIMGGQSQYSDDSVLLGERANLAAQIFFCITDADNESFGLGMHLPQWEKMSGIDRFVEFLLDDMNMTVLGNVDSVSFLLRKKVFFYLLRWNSFFSFDSIIRFLSHLIFLSFIARYYRYTRLKSDDRTIHGLTLLLHNESAENFKKYLGLWRSIVKALKLENGGSKLPKNIIMNHPYLGNCFTINGTLVFHKDLMHNMFSYCVSEISTKFKSIFVKIPFSPSVSFFDISTSIHAWEMSDNNGPEGPFYFSKIRHFELSQILLSSLDAMSPELLSQIKSEILDVSPFVMAGIYMGHGNVCRGPDMLELAFRGPQRSIFFSGGNVFTLLSNGKLERLLNKKLPFIPRGIHSNMSDILARYYTLILPCLHFIFIIEAKKLCESEKIARQSLLSVWFSGNNCFFFNNLGPCTKPESLRYYVNKVLTECAKPFLVSTLGNDQIIEHNFHFSISTFRHLVAKMTYVMFVEGKAKISELALDSLKNSMSGLLMDDHLLHCILALSGGESVCRSWRPVC
jgi:hypothetical protein